MLEGSGGRGRKPSGKGVAECLLSGLLKSDAWVVCQETQSDLHSVCALQTAWLETDKYQVYFRWIRKGHECSHLAAQLHGCADSRWSAMTHDLLESWWGSLLFPVGPRQEGFVCNGRQQWEFYDVNLLVHKQFIKQEFLWNLESMDVFKYESCRYVRGRYQWFLGVCVCLYTHTRLCLVCTQISSGFVQYCTGFLYGVSSSSSQVDSKHVSMQLCFHTSG